MSVLVTARSDLLLSRSFGRPCSSTTGVVVRMGSWVVSRLGRRWQIAAKCLFISLAASRLDMRLMQGSRRLFSPQSYLYLVEPLALVGPVQMLEFTRIQIKIF